MDIRDITNEDVAEFFKKDPALVVTGVSDDAIIELHEKGTYSNDNCRWHGLFEDNEMFCAVRYELFTTTTLNVHFYVSTKLQRNSLALEIQKFLKEWFNKEYPFIKKVQTMVPAPCTHVKKCCEKFDMDYEGTLKKCIIWRNELVDLHIYGKYIGVN